MVAGEAVSGTLYGIGVGPGDPELMTLKAARLIGAAQVVAWLVPEGRAAGSMARGIAAAHLRDGVTEIAIPMPMTQDRAPGQAAYDAAAARIVAELDAGRDVAVLCEGDPLFYGSFMYLMARMGDRPVQVVPGVTSVSAAAARARLPLVARNAVMAVLPGPLDDDELVGRIEQAGTVAVMKLGRHAGRIRDLAASRGWLDRSVYVAQCFAARGNHHAAGRGTWRWRPISLWP